MKQQTEQNYICRVCGYRNQRPFYDKMNLAKWEICPCCGGESGYEDSTSESAEVNRRRWIQKGAPWHAEEWAQKGMKVNVSDLKPNNWDLSTQLRNIGVDLQDYHDN